MLASAHLGQRRLRGLGLLVIGRQLRQRRRHRERQQFIAYARLALRPALPGHPSQKRPRIKVHTVAVQAAVGAPARAVSALDVAVGVFGVVRADDTGPALAVRAR